MQLMIVSSASLFRDMTGMTVNSSMPLSIKVSLIEREMVGWVDISTKRRRPSPAAVLIAEVKCIELTMLLTQYAGSCLA